MTLLEFEALCAAKPWVTADYPGKGEVVWMKVGDKRVVSTSGGRPFRGAGDDQVFNLNRGRQIFLEGSVRF